MNATSETAYKRITVSPIAGSLGAEIGGVDCTNRWTTRFAKNFTWLEILLFTSATRYEPEKQIAAKRGDIHLHAFNRPVDGYPEITQPKLRTYQEFRVIRNGSTLPRQTQK